MVIPRNLYTFRRYGYQSGATVTLNAVGQWFGTAYLKGLTQVANGFVSVNFPNYSEFTNLFDQYKIKNWFIEIVPRWDSQEMSSPALPTLYWYYDLDDSVTPADFDEIMQRANVHRAMINKPIRIYSKAPCVALETYRSAVTTAYSTRKSPWLDINYPDVPHYGIKFAVQGLPSSSFIVDVRVGVTFHTKGVR